MSSKGNDDSVYPPFRGKVVMTTGESEAVLYSDVDLGYLDSVREQIPVSKQKRYNVYQLVDKGSR